MLIQSLIVLLVVAITCLGQIHPKTKPTVHTIAGNGVAGYSADQLNNPYGLVVGPDGALYFCDLDNQRIRRLDLTTKRLTTIAGSGERGYRGDGGPAAKAQLRQPHSIVFDRDGALLICDIGNHRIRRVRLDSGIIDTYAGNGEPALTPDGAP